MWNSNSTDFSQEEHSPSYFGRHKLRSSTLWKNFSINTQQILFFSVDFIGSGGGKNRRVASYEYGHNSIHNKMKRELFSSHAMHDL